MRVNPVLDEAGAHPIAAVHQKVRDLRRRGEMVIDFSIGDPVEPTWPAIPEVVRSSVPRVSQYPTTAGLPELRQAVAGYVERRAGIRLDPDTQVVPTSGAKEAIFSSALAFIDRSRGDLVGYPDPGYPVYSRGAALSGATPLPIPATDDFVLTAACVPEEAWPKLAMLWVCSPSNPSGAVVGRDQMADLVDRCRAHDVLLCSDECYLDLYEPGDEPPVSALEVVGAGAAGVLSFLSLSKRSGMTGYRSGAVVGDAAAVERLHRLRTSTGTASPEFIQRGAITAWGDDEHPRQRRRIFSEKRRLLTAGLTALGLEVVASRAGLYLWVAVADDVAAADALAEAGIVVSPGRIFGARGEGHIRLALVPDLDDCRRAVGVFSVVLRSQSVKM